MILALTALVTMEQAAYGGNCVSCRAGKANTTRKGKGELRPYKIGHRDESVHEINEIVRASRTGELAARHNSGSRQDVYERILQFRRELDDVQREDIAAHWRSNRGYRREGLLELVKDLPRVTPYLGGGNPMVQVGSLAAFYDNDPRRMLYFKVYRGRLGNTVFFQDHNTRRIYRLNADETMLVDAQRPVSGFPSERRREIAVSRIGDPHYRPVLRGRETLYFNNQAEFHRQRPATVFDRLNEESIPSDDWSLIGR
jgi:hypothetical protein